MSATAEAPSRNGDGPNHDALAYRNAVKAKMVKYEPGPIGGRVSPSEREVDQFLIECRFYGLEPLVDQIYAKWEDEVMRAVTNMDGLRARAERTGRYESQDAPEWCDKEGNWTDYWPGKEEPVAARVRVHKKGAKAPTTGTANWQDFAPAGQAGEAANWNTDGGRPAHRLSLSAEALALRKAFPAQLSGLYTIEELGISPAAIGAGDERRGAPAADIPPAPPGPPIATAPAAGEASRPPETPAPGEAPEPAGADEGPSVIVDAPAAQPSGAPARPASKRTLAEALASGEYARLRGELTESLFAQMPDRLTDTQSERLAWLLAEAEAAGVTAVELERLCKIVLTEAPGDAPARERAISEWIAERRRQIEEERSQAAQHPAAEAPDQAGAAEAPDSAPPRSESLIDADPGPEPSE